MFPRQLTESSPELPNGTLKNKLVIGFLLRNSKGKKLYSLSKELFKHEVTQDQPVFITFLLSHKTDSPLRHYS